MPQGEDLLIALASAMTITRPGQGAVQASTMIDAASHRQLTQAPSVTRRAVLDGERLGMLLRRGLNAR